MRPNKVSALQEEGGTAEGQGDAQQSNMNHNQSIDGLQVEKQPSTFAQQQQESNVLSSLSTSPARRLRGEKVPAGQLLDYDFANLAWQDKGSSKLKCWQTMSVVRNICFVVFIIISCVIAFIYPSNVDGSLKSINSFVATTAVQNKTIGLKEIGLHHVMFFDDKTELHAKLGQADDAALEKDLCKKFRISLVEEGVKESHIFLSECLLLLSDTNKVILYNNLNNFAAYKVDSGEQFQDLDVAAIEAATKAERDSIEFGEDQSHWIWMKQDVETYKDVAVAKNLVIRSLEDSLEERSYANGNINSFIDNNAIVMQLRRKQVLGQERVRPQQIMLKYSKTIYKYYGSDTNINETSHLDLNNEGQFMLLEPIGGSGESNVENSLFLNTREIVTEYDMWGTYDYVKDVGSYLAIIFILVLVVFALIGSCFVSSFVKQFKELVGRKYLEASYLHQMKRYLKKFDQIYQALYDRKDEAEYKEIFSELELYLLKNYESMKFMDIKKFHDEMQILDQKLPDIDDVEDMLTAVRFQQPAAQKKMQQRINEVIEERTVMSMGQIAAQIQDRLSFYGLFALHDEVELNTAKMKAEMHIQNEKLEFLFRTLAERSERRSTRKRQKSISKRQRPTVVENQV